MIACDNCNEWYHGQCVGLEEEDSVSIDEYFCPKCSKQRSQTNTSTHSKEDTIKQQKVNL